MGDQARHSPGQRVRVFAEAKNIQSIKQEDINMLTICAVLKKLFLSMFCVIIIIIIIIGRDKFKHFRNTGRRPSRCSAAPYPYHKRGPYPRAQNAMCILNALTFFLCVLPMVQFNTRSRVAFMPRMPRPDQIWPQSYRRQMQTYATDCKKIKFGCCLDEDA